MTQIPIKLVADVEASNVGNDSDAPGDNVAEALSGLQNSTFRGIFGDKLICEFNSRQGVVPATTDATASFLFGNLQDHISGVQMYNGNGTCSLNNSVPGTSSSDAYLGALGVPLGSDGLFPYFMLVARFDNGSGLVLMQLQTGDDHAELGLAIQGDGDQLALTASGGSVVVQVPFSFTPSPPHIVEGMIDGANATLSVDGVDTSAVYTDGTTDSAPRLGVGAAYGSSAGDTTLGMFLLLILKDTPSSGQRARARALATSLFGL